MQHRVSTAFGTFLLVRGSAVTVIERAFRRRLVPVLARDAATRHWIARVLGVNPAARTTTSDLEATLARALDTGVIALSLLREEVEAPPLGERVEDDPGEGVGLHWIEIELSGDDDLPIPHARYEVTDGSGRVHRGHLDRHGRARVDRIRSGSPCSVSFPDLDADAWEAR